MDYYLLTKQNIYNKYFSIKRSKKEKPEKPLNNLD